MSDRKPTGSYSCGCPFYKKGTTAERRAMEQRACKTHKNAAPEGKPLIEVLADVTPGAAQPGDLIVAIEPGSPVEHRFVDVRPEPADTSEGLMQFNAGSALSKDPEVAYGAINLEAFSQIKMMHTPLIPTWNSGQVIPMPGVDVIEHTGELTIEPKPNAVMSAVEALQEGKPINQDDLEQIDSKAATLTAHTWTPGAWCRQRSRNRRTGLLIGLYALNHPDNTIPVPTVQANEKPIRWCAQCETHGSRYFHNSVNYAWRMRNHPERFCAGCKAMVEGGQVVQVNSTTKSQVVATQPKSKKTPTVTAHDSDIITVGTATGSYVAEAEPAETTSQDTPGAAIEAPTAVEDDENDPEAKVWREWREKLARAAPSGSEIDWVGPYHYCVDLPGDLPDVELMVRNGDAIFKTRLATGKDEYADTLAEMLDKLEVAVA